MGRGGVAGRGQQSGRQTVRHARIGASRPGPPVGHQPCPAQPSNLFPQKFAVRGEGERPHCRAPLVTTGQSRVPCHPQTKSAAKQDPVLSNRIQYLLEPELSFLFPRSRSRSRPLDCPALLCGPWVAAAARAAGSPVQPFPRPVVQHGGGELQQQGDGGAGPGRGAAVPALHLPRGQARPAARQPRPPTPHRRHLSPPRH